MLELIQLQEFAEMLLKSGSLTPERYRKLLKLADSVFDAGFDRGWEFAQEEERGDDR